MTRRMRSIRTLALVVLVGAAARCAAEEPQRRVPEPPTPARAAGESIYELDLALTDDAGAAVHLADLRGQTTVAAMIYTTCTSVCPRVTEDMKAIERQLPAEHKRGVTFALFSLDPGRDTPDALRRFAAEHGLDRARWRLFAASEDGVRDLAAVLGVKYKREEAGAIAHSATIFVIDREGIVRHRQLGLSENPRDLLDALTRAGS